MKNLNDIILSICIATYNRDKYIAETLESIIPQIIENKIEVILVDGASTDRTEEILLKYVEQYSQIKYFRLEEKGGVDKDYSISVEKANGKYCWLFTDDDIIKPGGISKVLECLKLDLPLYIINAEVKNIDFSKSISSNRLQIYENQFISQTQIDDLFRCIVPYVSFIGCTLIRKEFWNSREIHKYFGTEFIHVGVIFQDLILGGCYIVSEPIICIRFGNAQWSERSFDIWFFKWPNLLNSFEKISIHLRNRYNQNPSFSNLKQILVLRADGNYNYSGFIKKCSNLNLKTWWKIILMIISLVPVSLIKIPIDLFVFLKRLLKKYFKLI